jgi:hypothetical protein
MAFEIHQTEGFDPTGRMFSRDTTVDVDENGYAGLFRYEGLTIRSSEHPTVEEVLTELTRKLAHKGFRDLRTRVNFREERYLAERAPWTYYG